MVRAPPTKWVSSSEVRALHSHCKGHRFESCLTHNLVGGGRWFKPNYAHYHMIISLKTNQNPYNLMRSCGYYYQGADSKTGQLSFIRSITGSDYPRFHAYVKKENREVIINLHLDQKKPIYKGAPAHAGEYSGPVVEKEVERIKQILSLTN